MSLSAMGWARVAPSRLLLLCIFSTAAVSQLIARCVSRGLSRLMIPHRPKVSLSLSPQISVCVCVSACVMLWLAPQVPYSNFYNGGEYIHYPAVVLAATAVLAGLSFLPGACGVSHDSKASLIIVS